MTTADTPQVRFLRTAAGHHLAYHCAGQGSPLLVPPGWVSHLELQWADRDFRAFFTSLCAGHTLVTYDKHGTGLSDRDREDFGLEADLGDLEQLVEHLGFSRVDLFSFSMGGPLAAAYAARHPQRVRRLVLYGSFARGRDVAPAGVRRSMVELARAHWGLGARALAAIFIPDDDQPGVDRWSKLQLGSASTAIAARILEQFYATDVSGELAAIQAPTQVIHRRRDKAVPADMGRRLAAGVPGSRLTLLEGEVHLPWLGDAHAVVRAARAALDWPAVPEPQAPAPPGAPFVVEHRAAVPAPAAPSTGRLRVGLAQVDVRLERFRKDPAGLLELRREHLPQAAGELRRVVQRAVRARVELLVLPELAVDLKHPELRQECERLARSAGLVLVPGSYHDRESGGNVCTVFGPAGVLWSQHKHIPAILDLGRGHQSEAIKVRSPGRVIIGDVGPARVAVVICRDFLDLDLRAELKNAAPGADIVLNPALTPVTAEFSAAHFESRRSLYAYCFFCNAAAAGRSSIHAPERGRREQALPSGVEDLLVRDLDLFGLRAERRRWELMRRQQGGFIQSTR
jgi:pimeloyl-ACP methyl ester carboxylesterase/predicted amidohydrolase